MTELTDTVRKLSAASQRAYQNPYEAIVWPEELERDQWFTSPELDGLLSLVPGNGATPLYLVTGDFVSAAIVAVVSDPAATGVYNLAHAADRSLTLKEALDVVAAVFEVAAVFDTVDSFRRRRVLPPLAGDRETFDLLASGVEAFDGGIVRQSPQSVAPFARQLFVAKEVDNRRLRDALDDRYEAPDPAELVRRTCESLEATKWGRREVG